MNAPNVITATEPIPTIEPISNYITILESRYDTNYAFKRAISTIVTTLLENEYAVKVRYDDRDLGIVVVEYAYQI